MARKGDISILTNENDDDDDDESFLITETAQNQLEVDGKQVCECLSPSMHVCMHVCAQRWTDN